MKKTKNRDVTLVSLLFNFAYAFANCFMGFYSHSWWFITLGAYYSVLSIARFSVLQVKRRSNGDANLEEFAKKITGILLICLSVCLVGIVILASVKERGTDFHEIVMITIATYTFTKVTMAIIGLIKTRYSVSSVAKTLRNISVVDAFVSLYSMQRSMLVSFPGMTKSNILLFNILTGSAVCLIVLLLGINLIGGRCVDVAKSKIVKVNQKIADTVVDGYKKIENAVVDGYKKVENTAKNGYTKIEDKFVDMYLTKDGETVEEAKERLKNNKN